MTIDLIQVKSIAQKYGLIIAAENGINDYIHTADQVEYLPCEYQYRFIKYQEEYFKEKLECYQDISVIITRGQSKVGIWSLCILKNDVFKIGTAGGEILPPLFVKNCLGNNKSKRKVYNGLLCFLKEVAALYNVKTLCFREIIMGELDLWHKFLMESGALIQNVSHQLYFDLSLPEDGIDRLLHKTEGQRIKRGYELFDYTVITKNSCNIEDTFKRFREFHIEISGRETRGIETWKCQERGVMDGDDFLVVLNDKEDGKLAGMSLFVTTSSCAYYAVAVYDREKFDKPIGHVAQDIAIKHLRKLGVTWYNVGERTYIQDKGATIKTANIGLYKETFATHMFLKIVEEMKLD